VVWSGRIIAIIVAGRASWLRRLRFQFVLRYIARFDPGRDTDYPDRALLVFLSPSIRKLKYNLELGQDRFFTHLFFLFVEGPRSRCYGRTAALKLIVQPYEEDDEVFLLFHFNGAPVELN
jgi:hypothetical protein